MKFNTLVMQQRVSDHSRLKVSKNFDYGLRKTDIVLATKIFKYRKIERVTFLKLPIVIYHFLNNFDLSAGRSFQAVVNPIKITLSVGDTKNAENRQEAPSISRSKPMDAEDTTEKKIVVSVTVYLYSLI